MTDPEPHTPDDEDATNIGQSAEAPAEGADDTPVREDGSPEG